MHVWRDARRVRRTQGETHFKAHTHAGRDAEQGRRMDDQMHRKADTQEERHIGGKTHRLEEAWVGRHLGGQMYRWRVAQGTHMGGEACGRVDEMLNDALWVTCNTRHT